MAKDNRTIDFHGRTYTTQVIICDVCRKDIEPTSSIIVDQTALTLVHPDGEAKALHIPNDPLGYFRHYCATCVLAGEVAGRTKEEIENLKLELAYKNVPKGDKTLPDPEKTQNEAKAVIH